MTKKKLKFASLDAVREKALADPETRAEYEAQKDEFQVIELLVTLFQHSDETQAQIAEKMGTQKSNISRLINGKVDPRISTVMKFAQSCGFRLDFALTRLADEMAETDTQSMHYPHNAAAGFYINPPPSPEIGGFFESNEAKPFTPKK